MTRSKLIQTKKANYKDLFTIMMMVLIKMINNKYKRKNQNKMLNN